MKINTVAILGAGAVGCYFIYGLQEKLGENLWIVAEGERRERLEKEGLWINEEHVMVNVKTPEEAHGADLLLVALKYGALEDSLDAIEKVADEHTIVMSLMNGVDSEEIIGGRVGMEHMVYSLMRIASQRKGNSVVFDPEKTEGVFFGEAGKKEPTERILAMQELFADSGVHYNFCEDIIRDLWFKYALNISENLPQAIIGCGHGAYAQSTYVSMMRKKMKAEVVAVAAAKGIDISVPNVNGGTKAGGVNPAARFSTLQDLDAKRHTEIEMFSGALMRMGEALGVPTPYNEFAYYTIKAMEEKNDGMLP